MAAYQEAIDYKSQVAEKVAGLHQQRLLLEKQIEGMTSKTLTAKALLSDDTSETEALKEAQAELAVIVGRLSLIERSGGVQGILKTDDTMRTLAEKVRQDNLAQLEILKQQKIEMLTKFDKKLQELLDFENTFQRFVSKTKQLEDEINDIRDYTGEEVTKQRYIYKAAHIPRAYFVVFSDLQNVKSSMNR